VPDVADELLSRGLRGTVFIVGATDTGKTTLARCLYSKLLEQGRRAAYIDCDVGQSSIGPPGTLGLEYVGANQRRCRHLFFVGSNTPRGHFLPMVIGAHKLNLLAQQRKCESVIVDTTGLVDPRQGGTVLKCWKLELLRPTEVVAFQRENELGELLQAVGHEYDDAITVLAVPDGVQVRDRRQRYAYRHQLWRSYLGRAMVMEIDTRRVDVWNRERLRAGIIVGFDSAGGFCRGVGAVVSLNRDTLTVVTPLRTMERVRRIRVGDIRVDLDTYCELPRN